ncbi:alkylmercury lyase family protein [Pseudomonas frederiksbergensis]|uniref:Transmembrane protein n=1 Tax=Pseudomonas frederiksbergensis TaxID=104087 RepID=A0A0B1YX92_9PSED|nr:alkylmercury lyase family protein [Pseudomonas frederiksbergensis]KHK61548.1 transmembrane protein [Pseudomonas frederiksbergensis]
MNDANLHEAIISSFLQHQRPPKVLELAKRFNCKEEEARIALRTLADNHGVVLHPNSDEIWIAHPFSAAPTTCVVTSGDRKWWGNCAWCSLGVVHLAGGSAIIETRLGAIDDQVTIEIENGELLDTDYVVHFPIPMKQAWDNVIYTCSVQLLFRDEDQVDEWCSIRGIQKGDVRPIKQVWDFAAEWYARHADADWTKWTVHQAIEIFARHHLTGPIWKLSEEATRF